MIVRALAICVAINLTACAIPLRSAIIPALSQYGDVMPFDLNDGDIAEPEEYVQPLGLRLLFCPLAEILAAPKEEREAYLKIVDGLLDDPEAYGFRRETPADLEAEDAVDRGLAAMNQDWGV